MASGDLIAVLHPLQNEPPGSAFATLDSRNAHTVLDFDGSTDEEAIFTFFLPSYYGGNGLTVTLLVGCTSQAGGGATMRWQADIERIGSNILDFDADSFSGSFQSNGVGAPANAGVFTTVAITFTNGAQMDSLVAGEWARLKIRRDADGTSGTDDFTTDAELAGVVIKET